MRNQLVLKLHRILSSDSGFHRTLNSPIEYRESGVLNNSLNSDPPSWNLDQVNLGTPHRILETRDATARSCRAACRARDSMHGTGTGIP